MTSDDVRRFKQKFLYEKRRFRKLIDILSIPMSAGVVVLPKFRESDQMNARIDRLTLKNGPST